MVHGRRGPLLLAAGLGLAAWAAIVWQTGGFGIDAPWGRLSSRDPVRPLAAAILCVGALLWWTGAQGLRTAAERLTAWLHAAAPAGALLAAAIVCWAGVAFGTHVAGGSDPYGYVSQAELWVNRTLTLDFSSLAPLPWHRVEWTLSPLGYRPGTQPYTIVPTYAPGFPMLMALAQVAFGGFAKFVVVPICAAAGVWLTYLLGARFYDRFAGLLAAAFVAASPTFLYQTMWPMSDVPAAAFWTLSLVCACASGRFGPLAAGIGAAAAVLIRPNLLLLASVPALLIYGLREGTVRQRLRALTVYALALLPAIVTVAALNTHWYGGPARSGYGRLSSLYALGHFWPNASRYPRWLLETQTPLVLLAVLPLVTARLGPAGPLLRRPLVRAASVLFVALLVGSYFFYLVFEEWWYLRFFLPAFPLLMVLCVAGVRDLLHRLHASAAPAAVLVAALAGPWMVQAAQSRAVFRLHQQEYEYVTIARGVAEAVPPDGVVLAMQHSGSVRYYGDRLTLRYDQMPPTALDDAVRALEESGRRVYLLLERWEERAFIERFHGHSCFDRLDWPAGRTWSGIRAARLFELSADQCRKSAVARPARDRGTP